MLGCAPAPSPLRSSFPSSSAPVAPTDARLTVTASGQVACGGIGYGCAAYLVFQPNPTRASPRPFWTISRSQQVTFPEIGSVLTGPLDVGALPFDSPARIAPGYYDLAGVVNLVSDVASPITTPVPIQLVPTCLAGTTVLPQTSVTIKVTFVAAGGCTVKVSSVPEVPTPSGYPLGIVPPEAMTASVQNGTNLGVNVFVNESYVTSLAPGECVGCHGDDGIPAAFLGPLPWQVDVRTQGGRVLLSLPVHAGDVIQTSSSARGDAARVDLSCGRIDVWSGPPLAGPAPGPGTPGDCRP